MKVQATTYLLLLALCLLCSAFSQSSAQRPQSVILSGRFPSLNFTSGAAAIVYLKASAIADPELNYLAKVTCAAFTQVLADNNNYMPDAQLFGSISFSPSLWRQWGQFLPMPKNLFDYPTEGYTGPTGSPHMPFTGGELFIHVKGLRQDSIYYFVNDFISRFGDDIVDSVDMTNMFTYSPDGRVRDLTNFEDGRVNGLGAGSLWKDGIISGADPLHINGSFVYASKWVHDLETFNSFNLTEQHNIFGWQKNFPATTKLSLLINPAPQPYTHWARVRQRDLGHFLIRHSMPWGVPAPGVGARGLMFIAYTNNTLVLDNMLRAMVGQGTPYEPEGPVDGLFKFTRPTSGCYFYTPSLEVLAMLDTRPSPSPSFSSSPSFSASPSRSSSPVPSSSSSRSVTPSNSASSSPSLSSSSSFAPSPSRTPSSSKVRPRRSASSTRSPSPSCNRRHGRCPPRHHGH